MQETRGELVARFLRFVGEINDTDATALANDLCWQAIARIWLAHPFAEFVMPVDHQFSTVAGTALYVLPTHFGRIAGKEGIVRNRTTGAKIYPLRGIDLEERHPEIGTLLDIQTGEPTDYTISGKVGVSTQVASAGEALEVLSSSAADTTVVLQIEGLDSNAQWNTTQVTLNGITPVALGTWTYVQTIGKSYPAGTDPTTALTSSVGTITVRKVGSSTRQTLLPHESSREQYQLRLFKTPDQVYSIAVPVIRLPRRLFHDSDPIPAMWGPAVFEDMHIYYRQSSGEFNSIRALHEPRPMLEQLVGYDNELKPAAKPRKQPFGIGR